MIFFISKNKFNELFETDIKESTIEESLKYLKEIDTIAVDTETTGLNPHNNKLLTLQLGDFNNQYVIDCSTIDIKEYKNILESKELIFQNAKFDLRFLFKNNIWPNKIYDTYLAEVKLNVGIPNIKKNLQELAKKYCNTEDVDKTLRGLIHKEGLSYAVIKYAANDVKYLHNIKIEQEKLSLKQNLQKDIYKENRFVVALAYTEYCGMYIDSEKWTKKYNKSKELLKKTKDKLDKYILDNNIIKYIDRQLDLFTTEKKVIINWNSDTQVKPLFKDLGINIKVTIKGITKESVEAGVLLKQKDEFDIIPLYLEYKKWEKDCSTYGLSFLKHINKNTGRIHTNFTQCVDTGRMASGGKNKKTKEEYINFQNIPATPEHKEKGMIYARECIVPQYEDTIFVNADYSGQEQIVLANKSKDKDLIYFYEQDLGDMHSYIASKIFPEFNNLSLKEIKKNHKEERQIAKISGFTLNYGGTAYTMYSKQGIPLKKAEYVEKAYFEAFPRLKKYYDTCEQETLKNGYITVDNILGSKFYIAGFDKFKDLHNQYINKQLSREDISYYYRWKGSLRRNSLNYPIQGTSANITKIACIHLFDWILDNNLQNIIKIVNIVHDEVLLECPKNIATKVAKKLKEFMEKAGRLYCTIVPLKADPEISTFWNH